jgi:3-oxoacyl-[acyl-carrier protein] reductase
MKHAVITGGTGGLGSAVTAALRQPDWTVEALGSGDFDLRDETAIRDYFRNRKVDLLVCCAGITRDALLPRLASESWDETYAVNFTAAWLCAGAVLPAMIERGGGHVIFISSQSAIHPPAGQTAYATAKAALLGLTKDLARRHGPQNIRVNAILPGFLETPMTSHLSAQRRMEILAAHHLGRFNTPDSVARFIHFLHHSLPHTSGQIFQLDSRC